MTDLTPKHSDVTHGERRWTLWAFVAAGFLVAALLIWQLYGLTPASWCGIAKVGTENDRISACLTVLVRLLTIKDHVLIGLLTLLGISFVSLTVVVLGVSVKGTAPGGASIDVGPDTTHIATETTDITLPTPPSSGDK